MKKILIIKRDTIHTSLSEYKSIDFDFQPFTIDVDANTFTIGETMIPLDSICKVSVIKNIRSYNDYEVVCSIDVNK